MKSLTRRAAIAAALSTTATLALPVLPMAAAEPAEERSIFGRAAAYARKVAEALDHPDVAGDWRIIIRSGDAGQALWFEAVSGPVGPSAVGQELIDAIAAETATFLNDEVSDDVANAAVGRVMAVRAKLRALTPAEAAKNADYLPAMALLERRWLIMEDSYSNASENEHCLLVEAALAGTRFDAVPTLWPEGTRHA